MDINSLTPESEVLEHLKISRTTLWKLRKNEGLPSVKIGRQRYYELEKVVEWFVNREDKKNVEQ